MSVRPLLLTLVTVVALAQEADAAKPAPEVRAALELAESDPERAILDLEAAVDAARTARRAELMVYAGELNRLAGRRDRSRGWFIGVLEDPRASRFHEAARLGLALLDTGRDDAPGQRALITVSPSDALDSQNADRFAHLAERAAAEGRDQERDLHAARALDHAASSPALRATIEARMAALGVASVDAPPRKAPVVEPDDGAPTPGEVPPVRARPEPTRGADEPVSLADAREAMARGEREAARALAEALLDGPDAEDARALLLATDGVAVDPRRIGVLLPLSGRFEAVAGHVREAIEDGWRRYDAEAELVWMDSGASPERAVAALDDLVLERGVVAVLGPLLSDETLPVVRRAEQLAVPIVTLSQSLEDAGDFAWAFQAWMTPRQQVSVLLDHAVSKGITRYAVFAPDSDFGRGAAEAFAAEAEARSATITAEVFYDTDANDLSGPARGLATGFSPEDAPRFDFEAIFLPERASRVTLAAAGLAYAEFPVGTFSPGGQASVPLLGLSAWNSQELVSGGGSYTRNGLFTDVYVPPPSQAGLTWHPLEPWKAFTERMRAQTDRTPTAIEALASDAGLVLAAAAARRPTSRAAFRDALLDVSPRGAVTGARGFDPVTHELLRDIVVLQVGRDGFVPITPSNP